MGAELMSLYQVPTTSPPAAADLNQYVNFFTGVGGLYTDMVISNRISAGLTGATSANGFVGSTTGYSVPTSGTFNTGDWCVVQDAGIAVCTAGGTPGTWRFFGSWSYSDNATQSMGTNNQQLVSRTGRSGFDVILFNTSNASMPYFSAASYAYTIPLTGFYFLNMNVQFGNATAAQDQTIILLRNGAIAAMGPQFGGQSSQSCTFGTTLRLVSGDTLQGAAYSEQPQPSVFWGQMAMGLCLVAA